MSEQMEEETKAKQVYVAQEDVDAIERFFKHFKVTTSKEYNDARETFIANKTVDTQKNYRFQIAKECLRMKGQNDLLDDLFKNVIFTADKLSYDMQFDKDLEDIVGIDSTQGQVSKP